MGGKRLNQNHHSDGKGDQDAGAGSVEDEGVDQNAIDNIVIGEGDGGLQIAQPASATKQQTAPAPTAGDSLQPGGSGVFDAGIAQLSPAGGHNNQQEALDLPEIALEDLEAMVEADAAALAAEDDDEIDAELAADLASWGSVPTRVKPALRKTYSHRPDRRLYNADRGINLSHLGQQAAPEPAQQHQQQQEEDEDMEPASADLPINPTGSEPPPAVPPSDHHQDHLTEDYLFAQMDAAKQLQKIQEVLDASNNSSPSESEEDREEKADASLTNQVDLVAYQLTGLMQEEPPATAASNLADLFGNVVNLGVFTSSNPQGDEEYL